MPDGFDFFEETHEESIDRVSDDSVHDGKLEIDWIHINKYNNIPHLDGKIAISKDYFTKDKKNKWITNEHSRKRVHLLRSRYDCILSTSKTINLDNSLLNCRIHGLDKFQPDLFILLPCWFLC